MELKGHIQTCVFIGTLKAKYVFEIIVYISVTDDGSCHQKVIK